MAFLPRPSIRKESITKQREQFINQNDSKKKKRIEMKPAKEKKRKNKKQKQNRIEISDATKHSDVNFIH